MNEQGQGIVEFAVILLIVAVVVLIALTLFAPMTACGCTYSNIVTRL